MKRIRYLLLLVGMALFLAACGGGSGVNNGALKITLDGVTQAPVVVTKDSDNSKAVDENVTSGATYSNLAAGAYTVTAGAVTGFTTPAAQSVTIVKGKTTTVTLKYEASDGNGEPTIETGFQVYILPQEALAGATIAVVNAAGDVVKSVPANAGNPTEIATDPAEDLRVVVTHDGWTGGENNQWYSLEKGDVVRVEVTMARDGSTRGSVAADGISFTFGDVDGNAFATLMEDNPEKVATLVAAQTEEQVCVTVQVLDADDNPVRNAPVTVSSSDFYDYAVFYPGGCRNELDSAGVSGAAGLVTDADGNVTFSLQGLNAYGYNVGDDLVYNPVKVLVSAVGEDNVAVAAEFKLFFINMTHVYMLEGDVGSTLNLHDSTETRVGFEYDKITNIFEVGENGHVFQMMARSKQPTSELIHVNEFGLGFGYGNRVEYKIVEQTGGIQWDSDSCDVLSTDRTVCTVTGTQGAVLEPVTGTGLEDLPISAKIEATYYYTAFYGTDGEGQGVYSFPLKSYTVEKEWVGGFLEVDKYVDQHVLTWYGSAHTLVSHDQTGLTDGNYFSTVHVTVSNPSDATIYNVAVRDSVPAELGVVTSTISNGGTYDPTNHAVTWNYTNVAELAVLAPDASLTFTFDVYARQKPGFCWDTAQSTLGYVVQPGQSGAGTLNLDDELCYTDPYRVTNGQKYGSVNASGSFENAAGAAQHSFIYEPVDDESDIWVVRPLFTIDKSLMSSPTIVDGQTATFDVTITNVDRTIGEPDYASLAGTYPWEFGNPDTTSGSGHNADTSASRNNPYAHDVDVSDLFETGLEFTDGSNFSMVNGGGQINIPGPIVDKAFNWNRIVDLPVGVSAEATVIFTGHYLNDPAFVLYDDEDNPYNEWENCVYLYAPQLNQPSSGVTGNDDRWQVEDDTVPAGLTYPRTISDCATVRVIPRPPTPFVTLTTNGEVGVYTDATATTVVWDPTNGDTAATLDIPDMLRDGYSTGEAFYYILTVENPGEGNATNVMVTGSLTNNRVRLNTTINGYAWDDVTDVSGDFNPTTAGSFSFGPYDLDSGDKLVLAIPATTQSAGTVELVTQLTYSNAPSWQTLPLQVTEETSIQP